MAKDKELATDKSGTSKELDKKDKTQFFANVATVVAALAVIRFALRKHPVYRRHALSRTATCGDFCGATRYHRVSQLSGLIGKGPLYKPVTLGDV